MEDIIKIPEIRDVEIKDYGVIKKANLKFKKGLNIIIGRCGSGKTTVIKFLSERFNPNNLSFSEKTLFYIDDMFNDATLLIDNVFSKLDQESLIKSLKKLSSKKQVIIVLHSLKSIENKIKANIIDTKDFELKNKR